MSGLDLAQLWVGHELVWLLPLVAVLFASLIIASIAILRHPNMEPDRPPIRHLNLNCTKILNHTTNDNHRTQRFFNPA